MIQLRTLGTLDLAEEADGHQILSVLAQPKRVGFLAYLAVASPRGLQRRDTLLGMFWPDSSDKKARNALNQTVFVLRRALGQELFTMNGEPGIGVDPDHIRCDVWEFEAALACGEKEEALDLYRGNFLDGFFLPGCLEFERWVDAERARLRDLATGAVLSLSTEMESVGNPVGAVGWLRRAREWAVYDELILQRQIELLVNLGDKSGAVREYESYTRRLSVDLGMEPSEEVRRALNRPPVPMATGSGRTGDLGEGSVTGALAPASTPWPQTTSRRFSTSQTLGIAFLAAALGVTAAVSAPRVFLRPDVAPSSLSDPSGMTRTVAVFPLENATGDPSLADLGQPAADEILRGLASTGLANVGLAPATSSSPGQTGATDAPQRDGAVVLGGLRDADLVVTGSYTLQGGQLVYRTRILEAISGNLVLVVDSIMGPRERPEEAWKRLRQKVAGAFAMFSHPRFSGLVRIASHPPSLEAYQSVVDGMEFARRAGGVVGSDALMAMWDSASQAFHQAASADSGFTLPLILALEVTPFPELDSAIRDLRGRRAELPPWERAILDYETASHAADHHAVDRAIRQIRGINPGRKWTFRLAQNAIRINRPREALELLTALDDDPGWRLDEWGFLAALVDAKTLLGDHEGVLQDVERAREIRLPGAQPGTWEVRALARLGRVEEAADRAIEILQTTGQPGTQYHRYFLSRILRALDHEEEARRVAEAGLESLGRIEGVRPNYIAATYEAAGRPEEARHVLDNRMEELVPGLQAQAYTLLSYMAAREGKVEEATRLAEEAVTVAEAAWGGPTPYATMARVQAAAHLGDNAGAVRYLREAYEQGLPHGSYIFTRWDLRPLKGYKPFEDMMRPKG